MTLPVRMPIGASVATAGASGWHWRTRACQSRPCRGRFTEKSEIAASKQMLVPVLVDGDRWVSDSWAIANYLEDRYPDAPSLFGGEVGRKLTRHYSSYAHSLVSAIFSFVALDILHHVADKDRSYFRESREKRAPSHPQQSRRATTRRRSCPKTLRQLMEVVVHRLHGKQSVLLSTYVPGVKNPTHGAYDFPSFDEGLLGKFRDKSEDRINVLPFGRFARFHLRAVLLDIQKDAAPRLLAFEGCANPLSLRTN
jgi:hypothetical protein